MQTSTLIPPSMSQYFQRINDHWPASKERWDWLAEHSFLSLHLLKFISLLPLRIRESLGIVIPLYRGQQIRQETYRSQGITCAIKVFPSSWVTLDCCHSFITHLLINKIESCRLDPVTFFAQSCSVLLFTIALIPSGFCPCRSHNFLHNLSDGLRGSLFSQGENCLDLAPYLWKCVVYF